MTNFTYSIFRLRLLHKYWIDVETNLDEVAVMKSDHSFETYHLTLDHFVQPKSRFSREPTLLFIISLTKNDFHVCFSVYEKYTITFILKQCIETTSSFSRG